LIKQKHENFIKKSENKKIRLRKGGVQYFIDDTGKIKNSFEFDLKLVKSNDKGFLMFLHLN
jgi:hypothetical protein